MKPAWIWVWTWQAPPQLSKPYENGDTPDVSADLFFSSPEKFKELRMGAKELEESEALLKVMVADDFDDWDYIPDNY